MKLRVGNLHGDLSSLTGRGRVTIDSTIMDQMSLEDGEPVKIKGSKETIAKAVSSPPGDKGMGIIRTDKYIRENCGTSLGESVEVKPVDLAEARSVVLAPAEKGTMIQFNNKEALKKMLSVDYVKEGDKIVLTEDNSSDFLSGTGGLGLFGSELMVVESYPDNQVRLTENTDFEIKETKPDEFIEEDPEDYPISDKNVLKLGEEPDIEDKNSLLDFNQLKKLAEAGAFIGCYDSEDNRIWVYGNYYFIEEKE